MAERYKSLRNAVRLLLVFFSILENGLLLGQGYEVAGYFTNLVPKESTGEFTISVHKGAWKIRTTCEPFDYVEAGSKGDGEVFFLESHATATIQAARQMGLPSGNELNVAVGQVASNDVPQSINVQQIPVIWLAYASGQYFASRNGSMLRPVHIADQHLINTGLLLPAQWSLYESPPRLPRNVVYYNDGFTRGTDAQGVHKILQNREPYAKGYTNAIFQVHDTRAVGPIIIPQSFTFSVYRKKPGGTSSNDLVLMRQTTFLATRSSLLRHPFDANPETSGLMAIKDYRFTKSGIVYNYTTNRWLSTADVLANRIRMGPELSQSSRKALGVPDRKRMFARFLLVVGLAGVPLLLFVRNRQIKNEVKKLGAL